MSVINLNNQFMVTEIESKQTIKDQTISDHTINKSLSWNHFNDVIFENVVFESELYRVVFNRCEFKNCTFHGKFISCGFMDSKFIDCAICYSLFLDCHMSCAIACFSSIHETKFVDSGWWMSQLHIKRASCSRFDQHFLSHNTNFIVDDYEDCPDFSLRCPESGQFYGYKKVEVQGNCPHCNVILKLMIPARAKRSSALTNKCRCSEAKVVGIYDYQGKRLDDEFKSHDWKMLALRDSDFLYGLNQTVKPELPFEEDRWNECSSGIHFYMQFRDAVNY